MRVNATSAAGAATHLHQGIVQGLDGIRHSHLALQDVLQKPRQGSSKFRRSSSWRSFGPSTGQ